MREFVLPRILPAILAATLGCAGLCAQEKGKADGLTEVEAEKLDSLLRDFNLAHWEITQVQWVEPMEKLRKGYRERMQKVQDSLAQTGNLANALAAQAAAKTDPTAETIHSDVKEIAAVQQTFIDAQKTMQKRRDESHAKLARSHVAQLSTIREKLTKAKRLDSALAIDQMIKELRAKGRATAGVQPRPPIAPKPRPKVTFRIVKGRFTWHEAKADAEKRGGRLAVLNTQEKINTVNASLDKLGTWPDLWIGLTDEKKEGDWRWITGEVLQVSNWRKGKPDNTGNEYVCAINGNGRKQGPVWDDREVSHHKDYLLELGSRTR